MIMCFYEKAISKNDTVAKLAIYKLNKKIYILYSYILILQKAWTYPKINVDNEIIFFFNIFRFVFVLTSLKL